MIEIYTDGSCWPNDGTGNGTFGFVVIENNKVLHQFVDGRFKTTNNKMELLGVITAIKYALEKITDDVLVFCDSQYVVKGYNDWSFNWFGDKPKADLKNSEMWEYLHKLRSPKIKLQWIKGHDLSVWNNYVDGMCNEEFKNRYGFMPDR